MLEIVLYCLLFGGIAGLLAGLFGLGGGLILVPFLLWLFTEQGFAQEKIMIIAVATSLATIIITSIASVLAHHRLGSVLWRSVYQLVPGVFLGAMLGAIIADVLDSDTLKSFFAVFLIYVGLQMAFQFKPEASARKAGTLLLGLAGILIGVLSAILGIGGGTLTVPLLNQCNYPMRNAVAISSACGFPIALAGTISYALLGWNKTGLPAGSLGYVFMPAFLGIVATSTFMAPVGAKLAHRFPMRQLQRYFSVVLFVVAGKLLW